jgi:Hemerythrin HHE cation binding domain
MGESASAAETVLSEHARLRGVLAALERAVATRRVDEEGVWRERLVAGLDASRIELAAHFSHEEKSGFFESVVLEHPEADRLCARLAAEHGELLVRLGRLVGEARGGAGATLLASEVMELLADVQRHEQTENQLLLDSVELPGVALD